MAEETKTTAVPVEAEDEPRETEELTFIGAEERRRFRQRWDSIQTSFVDEPRDSVREADGLVEALTDVIERRFEEERRHLEEKWEEGESVSTETLRVTLRRYRSLFDRLLSL